jgi:hypothetical protein
VSKAEQAQRKLKTSFTIGIVTTSWFIGGCRRVLADGETKSQLLGDFSMVTLMDVIENAASRHFDLKQYDKKNLQVDFNFICK